MQINRFNDRPQFVASIRPLGPFAFLLFSATGDSEEPYQSSSPNHTFTDHDRCACPCLCTVRRAYPVLCRPMTLHWHALTSACTAPMNARTGVSKIAL